MFKILLFLPLIRKEDYSENEQETKVNSLASTTYILW